MLERPLREIAWVGDSKERLKEFPKPVQKRIGDALFVVQVGDTPNSAKPLKGVGSGVFEIVQPFATYRAVYAVKLGERIYVLHAFQKKSKRGIKTPQQEIDLIQRRFKIAQQMEAKNE
jgi:phage-related protein